MTTKFGVDNPLTYGGNHISMALSTSVTDRWIDGIVMGGSVAEWLACRTQARKSTGSNRSRDAVE